MKFSGIIGHTTNKTVMH